MLLAVTLHIFNVPFNELSLASNVWLLLAQRFRFVGYLWRLAREKNSFIQFIKRQYYIIVFYLQIFNTKNNILVLIKYTIPINMLFFKKVNFILVPLFCFSYSFRFLNHAGVKETSIFIWPLRHRAQFRLENHMKEVAYEGLLPVKW